MTVRHLLFAGAIAAFPAVAVAQPLHEKIRAHRIANERAIIEEYLKFLALPNVTADRAGIRRNADFIVAMMKARGIASARLLEPKSPGNPAVFGEVRTPGATRTVLFYAHYDGQPVNPAQWARGWEPFQPKFVTDPVERGGKIIDSWRPGDPVNPQWRLAGRGSADDKAGVMTILNAYSALVQTGAKLGVNLKFYFDGEEEIGSVNLREVLEMNRELVHADLWIITDGPCHVSGRKTIYFGVRGDVNVNLTTYGAKRPLHSGNYGNWAPNPAAMMVNLLASMKDDDGRVLIKGFYDDVTPLTETERRALAAIPSPDAELARELGVSRPETPGRSMLEGLHLPTLNINGIGAANVAPLAANIIPTVAKATLDLRLVLGDDVKRQVAKVVDHIKAQGFHVIDREPTEEERAHHGRIIRVELKSAGYNAQRTPMDLPVAKAVIAAVQSTTDHPVVLQPSLGGSLPLIVVEEVTGARVITVPVVNYDNNQHAENENVKVQFLWDGIETMAALMAMRL